MIPILKKRLSRNYIPFIVSLLLPLVSFFVYAARYESRFFLFLTLAFAVNIVILFFFYQRLKRKHSQVKLQREEFFEKTNLLKADLDRESALIEAFRKKIFGYSRLKGFVERLGECLSLDDTLHVLSRETALLFGPDEPAIIVYLCDPHSAELAIASAESGGRSLSIRVKRGDVFDRWVIKNLQPLLLEDILNDFRFDAGKREADTRQVRSLLSVPLMVHNTPVGILRVDSPLPNRFHEEDLRFLKAIGDPAAVALENAQLYDRVEDLAIRDGLTGLFLKRYFLERCQEEVQRHTRTDRMLALLFLDLDHFKGYNDRFGHMAGDILLKHLAALLKKHFGKPGNIICRYGGEEFCVLLAECSLREAMTQAQVFVRAVESQTISLRREKTRITISAGVAAFPGDARAVDELVARADAALYMAKNKGRNRVCAAGG